MDERRKCVLLIAASILVSRKLVQYAPGEHVSGTICAVAHATRWPEEIMEEIGQQRDAAVRQKVEALWK